MLFMISNSMEPNSECEQNVEEKVENKTETVANASDRESSIESVRTNKSEFSIANETELINIDDIELSDEESWLYKSPKKQLSEEKSAITEEWVQKNIDNMDDIELKETRTALLSKLNQLKLLNSSIAEKEARKGVASNLENSAEKKAAKSTEVCKPPDLEKKSTFTCVNKESNKTTEANSQQNSWKKSEVFDVLDVQKIARLQEESLKQSTYKFLSNGSKNAMSNISPASPAQIVGLNKPASVEALHTSTDKINHSSVYSIVPHHGLKKQNMFSSSSVLNYSQEFHRGSLPNINKGYYSLKSKKAKRPSEPKVSCPLPVYPSHSKISVNGTTLQGSFDSHNKSAQLSSDQRETRTLPSSYRIHSKSNSSSRKDLNIVLSSPRRESMPFLGNNSKDPTFRDNHRKFSSPVSSAVYPRYPSSSATTSPTKSFNSQSQSIRSPPGLDYHRAASHSPSRRLPLSTVQHQSPRKGNNLASPRNGEIRTLKVPTKISSPALKSGIPVPSTVHTSRANEDDNWSKDCF